MCKLLDKVQPKNKEQLKQLINYAFKHNIYDLNFIDTSEITDMSKLFMSCDYNIDVSRWDVSNVKNMCQIFYGCIRLNTDLSVWNVSNVTDMNHMFFCCENFDIKCFDSWDVSNVTDMTSMFAFCNKFDCDLSNWDVSNVTGMYYMFGHCKQFDCDLSHWNTSKVKDMKNMFTGCNRLTIPDWYKQ